MIEVRFKPGKDKEYRRLIDRAKRDGVFKACGNPEVPWVLLKFEKYLLTCKTR